MCVRVCVKYCICMCLCVGSRSCESFVSGRRGSDSNIFLNKQLGVLQQIRLYIPRGTLPYDVTAQHGILGTACGDDLSLSDAPYTAKNVHLNK